MTIFQAPSFLTFSNLAIVLSWFTMHMCASALHPNCWIKGCELILEGEMLNSVLEFSFVSLNLEVCVHYLMCTSINYTIVVLTPMIFYLSTKLVTLSLRFNHMIFVFVLNDPCKDSIIVVVTNVFAIAIVYSTTCTKKYRPHMANFVIQLDYYPFNVPIHGSCLQLSIGLP
jgi:hypothetical protein